MKISQNYSSFDSFPCLLIRFVEIKLWTKLCYVEIVYFPQFTIAYIEKIDKS